MSNRGLNAVIYSRVSTDEQKESGFSLQDQERRLREYCRRKGYNVVAHYQDNESAKTFERKEFNRFLREFKEKKIQADVFVVIRMDRFSRNSLETLKMIDSFKKWKLKFETIENSVNLDTPEELIPFMLNVVLPEVDNLRRGVNTKRGLRQAMREGRWTGIAPYGYRNNKVTKLVEVEDGNASIVKFIFETFSLGVYSAEDVRRMVRQKGCKLTKQGFLNLLRNPFYVGKIRIPEWKDEKEELVSGRHTPLISEQLFNKVQTILSGKKKPYKGHTKHSELPLSGILICQLCNKPMTGSASKGNGGYYHYYHCQGKYGCKNRLRATDVNEKLVIYLKTFEPAREVLDLYYEVLNDVFKSTEAEKEQERNRINKTISDIDKQISNLDSRYLSGEINSGTYNRILSSLESQKSQFKEKLEIMSQSSRDYSESINYSLSLLQNISRYYQECDTYSKKRLLGSIFPEKLIFENNSYRTTRINQVFSLHRSLVAGSGKKKVGKNADLSSWAPPVGLEPATL